MLTLTHNYKSINSSLVHHRLIILFLRLTLMTWLGPDCCPHLSLLMLNPAKDQCCTYLTPLETQGNLAIHLTRYLFLTK